MSGFAQLFFFEGALISSGDARVAPNETKTLQLVLSRKDFPSRRKLSFSRCQRVISMVNASLAMELDFVCKVLCFQMEDRDQLVMNAIHQPTRNNFGSQIQEVFERDRRDAQSSRDQLPRFRQCSADATGFRALQRTGHSVQLFNVGCRTVHLTKIFLHFCKLPMSKISPMETAATHILNAHNDNEEFSFITLAAATANVVRYLDLAEKQNEEPGGDSDRRQRDKGQRAPDREYVEQRLRDIAAFERSYSGVKSSARGGAMP
jgi:hypothetical protein